MLDGLILIKPKVFVDKRGFFLESFNSAEYKEKHGIRELFLQDNHSYSKKDVIRGMHFQKGQAKLVRCAAGKILDVVVDIRKKSNTFGRWESFVLDEDNHNQLYIPDGFAHGFCVLSVSAHVLYKVSSLYDPNLEKGFRHDDREVGIKWPAANPIVSDRDREASFMKEVCEKVF